MPSKRGWARSSTYSERRTRAAIAELEDGEYRAEDVLEGGPEGSVDLTLRVRATIAGETLALDFTGSEDQVEGNLNCPLSVTKSAAFFAVRVLTDPDAPPSAGAHRPVEVIAPLGCLLNARPPAAVVAGNVETSSRVADLVIAALAGAVAAPAQGQGTMNNLTLADGDGLHLLRDDRRRSGRLPRCRRAERDPRRDVEHPQHARRGARDRVPVAGARAEPAARLGRGGPEARRRRDRARARGAGADALHPDHRAPPPPAARSRRRRGRRQRAETCSTAANCPRNAPESWCLATACGSRRPGAAEHGANAT